MHRTTHIDAQCSRILDAGTVTLLRSKWSHLRGLRTHTEVGRRIKLVLPPRVRRQQSTVAQQTLAVLSFPMQHPRAVGSEFDFMQIYAKSFIGCFCRRTGVACVHHLAVTKLDVCPNFVTYLCLHFFYRRLSRTSICYIPQCNIAI